ncbi:MAG: L-threonylcarbamoyladenylate synthase [Actinomycetota bacterium]
MTEVFEVDPRKPDVGAVAAASEALIAGGVVIFPTETVYGIAARPDDPLATERLFAAKDRPRSLNLPVLVSTTVQAWEVSTPHPQARRLGAIFWPGPLTMVLPRTDRSRPWALGDRGETIGVRVPDHPLTRTLLENVGPVAATSANPSGQAPLADRADLVRAFHGRAAVILALAPGAAAPAGVPSTVVGWIDGGLEILRSGGIGEADLQRAAEGEPAQGQ